MLRDGNTAAVLAPPQRGTEIIDRIRRSLIGDDVVVEGPFGGRRLVYADYTASGRALSFVEDYIRARLLPLYANTHTDGSATGRHTTRLREEARAIIHRAVGAGSEDVVLFCGSGSTAAINALVRLLAVSRDERAVVFIGPYEHHSNELPWRESLAEVVTIRQCADGGVDVEHLDQELARHAERPLRIGSFSAASNVTGIITDVERVASVLRRHGALSCWDYATAGPYVAIDMAGKDAVFLSPHRFVGGPGTPGVLVVKRALVRNPVPSVPGGGTVVFVSPRGHTYHCDPVIREEGGTPGIVESIRAGLVFALRDEVGAEEIRRREQDFARRALASWAGKANIEILGNPRVPRLAIISFALRHPPRLLHASFVVALLGDLFGIQARSGCFCAGPYLHRLYGVDDAWSARMEAECARGHLGAKLGFVRLSLGYFISETVFRYIVEAVELLADHAWKLLPLHQFDPASGFWRHRTWAPEAQPGLRAGLRGSVPPPPTASERVLARQLDEARSLIRAVEVRPPAGPLEDPVVSDEFEHIRWFAQPAEALRDLRRAAAMPPPSASAGLRR